MNALDQAFIKAFAKDRTPTATAQRRATAVRAEQQPPADGVESVSLVLHELYQQGKRLRIDRPMSDSIGLAAHVTVPLVEHVESYQLEDVQHATQSPVVFEDRLTPLGQIAAEVDELLNPTAHHMATRRQEAELVAHATELDSNVKKRTEAIVDKEVPTLDSSADQPELERQQPAEEPSVSAEDQLLAQCSPQVLLATTECDAPELMTCELGLLEQAVTLSLSAATSALEVSVPHIDLEAVATQLQQLPNDAHDRADDRLDAIESDREPEMPTAVAEPTEEPVESLISAEVPGMSPLLDRTASSHPIDLPEAPAVAEEPILPSSTLPPAAPFTPAWEVDGFRWPLVCQQLDERTDGRLTDSGGELFAATQDGLKVLAVTSADRMEGRTTLALSLARTAAIAGSRVALLDADAANPELARRLGMEAPCDWSEVVRHGESLSEAAVASLQDGVTLFPRTLPNDNEVGVFDKQLVRTLNELSQHFDLVVVDLPPISSAATSAAEIVSPCPVDMAVVVRNVQTTPPQQCLDTVAALRRFGVRAVGVIENFMRPEDLVGLDDTV